MFEAGEDNCKNPSSENSSPGAGHTFILLFLMGLTSIPNDKLPFFNRIVLFFLVFADYSDRVCSV